MKDVLFLVPYPLHRAPSQRFRVELFEPILQKHNIRYTIEPFLDEETWRVLYQQSSLFKKVGGILKSWMKRFLLLPKILSYRYVFIHREAAPIGPPLLEWIIAKLFRKKIIYDFDDAIWIPNTSEVNKIAAWVKAFWKVKYICKWSHQVVVGNEYLRQYALQYNANVIIIPTCVDVERGHYLIKQTHQELPVVGWTGSQSTLFYLDEIVPLLQELQEEIDFTFIVIANKQPELPLKNWKFIPWKEATEQKDLLNIDIGIMPLKADAWSEGKCGFKLIQYLALSIPAVAAPVGINKTIIEEGINGYLCEDAECWKEKLRLLLTDASLREKMGYKGREKIVKEYSIQAYESTFITLFKKT